MSRSITGAVLATGRRRWTTAAVACVVVAGTSTALAVGTGTANAATPTAVTRAAIAPSLVAGRGASVAFNEQEAENAATNGTVIPFDTSAYTVAGESSGRSAVSLTPGQYVEFTLPAAANAITVRYSIPDAPNGGGITAPLTVTVNGHDSRTMTLTSQYSYLYNIYPFTNDPHAARHRAQLVARGVPVRAVRRRRRRRCSRIRFARRTSTTSSACCSARRTRPATRSASPSRPAATPPPPSST